MLWYACRLATSDAARKRAVLAACACARLALSGVPRGEQTPRQCIETVEAWTRGEATLQEVQRAAVHTRRVFHDTLCYSTVYAADAAADAALCADSAATKGYFAPAARGNMAGYAASCIAAAAIAALSQADNHATDHRGWAAGKTWTLTRCAHIVRRHFPTPPAPTTARKGCCYG
jgi:hypothetical protein